MENSTLCAPKSIFFISELFLVPPSSKSPNGGLQTRQEIKASKMDLSFLQKKRNGKVFDTGKPFNDNNLKSKTYLGHLKKFLKLQ